MKKKRQKVFKKGEKRKKRIKIEKKDAKRCTIWTVFSKSGIFLVGRAYSAGRSLVEVEQNVKIGSLGILGKEKRCLFFETRRAWRSGAATKKVIEFNL